ncbi:MAG: TetR/AcrR family transcriptional regulator [Hungatella sp.]
MQEEIVHRDDRTEERILEAALDVIEEKTISGTRMRLIADRAELFQSNIHYYYKSKQDLLLAVQKRVLKKCIDLRKSGIHPPGEDIDSQLDIFIDQKRLFLEGLKKYDAAELDFWVQSRHDESMATEFRNSFQNWRDEIAEVLVRHAPELPKPRIDLCAALFVSILEGATVQYQVDAEAFDLDEYFELGKTMIKAQIHATQT